MFSMTGFGSAKQARAGTTVSAEVRSVNNRFLKVSVRCPGVLSTREHEIEGLVRERIQRGTVSLSLRVSLESRPIRARLNTAAVKEYMKLFGKLGRESGIAGEPTLELLAGLPGVLDVEEQQPALPEEGWELVKATVGLALDRLLRMRKREGANLKRDFSMRSS